MLRFIIRRLLLMLPVLFLVSATVFSLILLLPGDPATAILGEEARPESVALIKQELGLDQPIPVQYFNWLVKAVHGDLGHSIHTRQPVIEIIGQRIAPTIQLAFFAVLISLIIAFVAGIISATRRNSPADVSASTLAFLGVSIPDFWLGMMLILIIAMRLRWLPPTGYVSPLTDLGMNLKMMILPSITLGAASAAVLTRQIRSSLLDVLNQPYILTARSKGLMERLVITRHALKNALIPVVTIVGLQIGRLFGGALITEMIFSIPGIGRLAVESIFTKDFPVLQGVVLIMALAALASNLVVDILYAYLDPRIKFS